MSEIRVQSLRGLGVSTSGPAITLTNTGSFNFDSGTFFVDSTNNRLGVNKINPAYDLDIQGSVAISGITRLTGAQENLSIRAAGESGNQTYNFNTAAIFWHPSVNGDINAFLTNVPTEPSKVHAIVIVFVQGGTARRVTNTFNINGTNITVRWSGGTEPTVNPNSREAFNFTIVNTSTTSTPSWEVMGTASYFV
jgi:hypothetical protein